MSETTTFGALVAAGHLDLGDGYRTKRSEHGQPGLPILRVAEVLDGRISPAFEDYVSDAYRQAMGPKISKSGDVVLTTKGTVGRVAIVPSDSPEFVYSPQLCYFRIRPGSPLNAHYLYYWFRSDYFWSQAGSRKSQTDMADYINLADIRSLQISLPPPSMQQSIVEVLGALDGKIAVNEWIATTCNDLAQAHIARASADAVPVRLADVAVITMGSSPPGETYNEAGIGLPFYQGTRDFGVRFPTRRVWCSEPVRVASPGSTLVSVRAPVGRLNMAVEECCIGRGLAALASRDGTPSVLYHALRATPEIWQPFESQGTVFGAINKGQIENLPIPAFNTAAAKRLDDLLSPLDTYVRQAFQENVVLWQLRDTLLPGLMSGEIRVRDAEKAVEEAT